MDLTQLYFPQVVSFSPTTVSTGVGTRPSIIIEFSTSMDEDQFNTLSSVITLSRVSNGISVPLSLVSYEDATYTLTLTTTSSLVVGEPYQVRVSSEIKSSSDRLMSEDVVWSFTPDTPSMDIPILVYPPDESAYENIPSLTWTTTASATTGTYYYQVGSSRLFNDESLVISSSTSGTTASLDPTEFELENEYYWRVCSATTTSSGDWSDYNSFYYGVLTESDVDSALSSPYASILTVTLARPTSSNCTNLSAWPLIRVTLSSAIASTTVTPDTFWIEYIPVDDNPAGSYGTLSGSIETSGRTITFTPSADILQNTRYTIYVSGVESTDGIVVDDYSYSFTGQYYPLYVRSGILRNGYGSLISTYTNDFLNYQLYRASIACNRAISGWVGDTTNADFITEISPVTYDMIRFTELNAAYAVLQLRYFDILESADSRRQLGDFVIDQKATALVEVDKSLKDIKKELSILSLSISRNLPGPTVGIRSSSWSPALAYDDSIRVSRSDF